MKRHSILSTIACVSFLMLPIVAVSCGGETGGDLFVGGKPKTDAGNTGATGGMPATGGASGTGARGGSSGAPAGGTGALPTGGSAGASDASAGASGAGTGGASGAGATTGTGGTAGIASSGGTMGTAGSGGSAGVAASGGTAGTAGSGGTAGTAGIGNPDSSFGTGGVGNPDSSFGAGGTAGNAGTSGTAGADAGPDASGDGGPKQCSTNADCGSDEFCSKITCVMLPGECKPRPKVCANNEAPVCGCDGVNYWNDCLRQQAGIASGSNGECAPAASCGGLPGFTCPGGRARCAHLHTTELECGISDAFGTCWVIPEQCPEIVVGASHRACSGSTDRCVSRCEAIKTEHDYFTDSTCPQ